VRPFTWQPFSQPVLSAAWIGNKQLFAAVANGILNGDSAITIAKRHNIPELAVIGARKIMNNYFTATLQWHNALQPRSEQIHSLLAKTRFWDTFTQGWASEGLRSYIKYAKICNIDYAKEVARATIAAFK